DVAACDEQGTFTLGAEAKGFDVGGRGNLRRAHGQRIGGNGDGDLPGLAGRDVVDVQLAIGFVDDLILVVGAGPAHVPFGAVGELLGLFRCDVVSVEIESVVFVRGEKDFAADPHGIAMGARVVGDFFGGVGLQIENVELLRPAAGIALPGA